MKRLTVIIADDHAMVAESLAAYLREHCELAGVAKGGDELMRMVRSRPPDVVVVDLSMPVTNGLECLRMIREERHPTKVIILTMHKEAELACRALRAGAAGYMLKQSAAEELLTAIHDVESGKVYLSKDIAEEVLAALADPATQAFEKLTHRQREVLDLVSAGRTMKEIGIALHLSPRTVETHKYEMMEALGIHSTAELIQFALTRDGL